ncbi:putative coiled-coil domain-containing protein 147 [Lasius niger]|uniref:Putative coiled-coil domain-containing protein 147 n=1 Tax=Lasius niger TaxID=67767 RepID=A0A0J7KXP3_LASNI|nr:putative coiled-coil domain-containing protein 147 [Lasius niger]
MKANEALAPFEAEYARLYESLYKAHTNEKELSEQCLSLRNEIEDNTYKIYELRRTVETHEDEIAGLRQEVVNTTKLADAAHAREQNAQEVIENLRLNIAKLGLEIEQKNKQLAAEKDITISKQKENLLKERERLVGEIETMKQRQKNMSAYTEELEKRNSEIDQRMNEMQETLGMQLNEISLINIMEMLRNELMQIANASIEAGASNIARLENLAKEQRTAGEKMQKEIGKLMLKRMNLQTDLDNANVEMEKLEKEVADKEKQLRNIKHELNRTKESSAKCKYEKDLTDKRLLKAETERTKVEHELKQALIDIKNTEHETQICRKEQLDDKQRVETLLRERNAIARSRETAQERIKRLNHDLLLYGQAKTKVEHELDALTQSVDDVKRQMETVEKERDKYGLTIHGLEQQIEGHVSETKLRQAEIFDYKKRLAEAETRYRQQQSLFETVRAERNLYSKSLVEAQEEVRDLKSKLKITSQQIEQLREDIATKEASLVKEEFLLGRIEKEKEDLKVELKASRVEVSGLRQEIEGAKREEKRLRQAIQQADVDIGRRKKDIDNVMNERDILGTQLVRRNDELSLQYSRMKGTDPSTFDMVKKVQILQERILKMSTDMMDKERKLRDTEKLYMNLRDVLSRQPDPQAAAGLNKVQNILRKRGEKLKCLVAELNVYEVQLGEYKGDMERMGNEMCELKKKYYAQKRKLEKMKETSPKSTYEPILPSVLVSSKKFCGGGFKMTTPTPRSCYVLDSSASR